jgi:uncharacterized protein YcbK (DUF882 family)
MSQISKHISYNEAVFSEKAVAAKVPNVPNEKQLEAMQLVAEKLFEPLRYWYGKPIKINSFFRNNEVNKLVGGSKTSQHCKGEAIDISAGSKAENKKLFDYVCKNLDFDQVINEYDFTWVHISYKEKGNRKQILVIK